MSDEDIIKNFIAEHIPECVGIREVVQTFVADKNHRQYRFEIVKNLNATSAAFDVEAYYLNDNKTWIKWTSFPASYSDSPRGVMMKAMGWFREREA
jgi:hypothetical protein